VIPQVPARSSRFHTCTYTGPLRPSGQRDQCGSTNTLVALLLRGACRAAPEKTVAINKPTARGSFWRTSGRVRGLSFPGRRPALSRRASPRHRNGGPHPSLEMLRLEGPLRLRTSMAAEFPLIVSATAPRPSLVIRWLPMPRPEPGSARGTRIENGFREFRASVQPSTRFAPSTARIRRARGTRPASL